MRPSCESNPSRRICHRRALPPGPVADCKKHERVPRDYVMIASALWHHWLMMRYFTLQRFPIFLLEMKLMKLTWNWSLSWRKSSPNAPQPPRTSTITSFLGPGPIFMWSSAFHQSGRNSGLGLLNFQVKFWLNLFLDFQRVTCDAKSMQLRCFLKSDVNTITP